MSLVVTIDGTDYPILDGTLEIQLNKGVAGCSLACELPPGSAIPQPLKPIAFDGLGVEFNGRIVSLPDNPKPGRTVVRVTAVGPQIFLKGTDVDYTSRSKNVSDILADLILAAGLSISGSVLSGDKELYGFNFKGSFVNALAALSEKAGLEFWIDPAGSIKLVDPNDRPANGLDWVVGTDTGFAEPSRNLENEVPPNRIIVIGGVPPVPGSTDTDQTMEFKESIVGKQWYQLPDVTDNLDFVKLDGDELTIAEDTTPEAATSDVVFYPRRFGRQYWFWLRTAPTSGQEVNWQVTIQFARGQADDEDAQTEFGAVFSETVEMPEIRTSAEAQQAAEAILARRKLPKVSATATVFDGPVYKPCEGVTHTDSRRPGFPSGLGVVTNVLRQAKGREAWIQTVTIGNEAAQPPGLLGLALELTGGSGGGRSVQIKTPPTYTPAAASPNFTISIDPTTANATDGTNTALEYTVTVTDVNGFTGNVALNRTGLTGLSVTFDPAVITGGSGTSTMTVAPTGGGNWVDANTNQEGTLTVHGVSGSLSHSTTADVVIDPGCASCADYAPTVDSDGLITCYTNCGDEGVPCEWHATVDFPAGSCAGDKISYKIMDCKTETILASGSEVETATEVLTVTRTAPYQWFGDTLRVFWYCGPAPHPACTPADCLDTCDGWTSDEILITTGCA